MGARLGGGYTPPPRSVWPIVAEYVVLLILIVAAVSLGVIR